MSFSTLSILIPAFNEEATILQILNEVKRVTLINDIKKEVIVINDASTDNTKQLVEDFISQNPDIDLRLINQSRNQGKGAALQKGINLARGQYLIIQDADLEYDPHEYNLLIKPVFQAGAQVVYGSRFIGGNPHRILFFWHSIGNKLLTTLSNLFTDLNLTDMETCYKLIKTDLAQSISIKENRFGIEPEITAKLAKIKGIKFYEVGISYYGRTYQEGKKIGLKDGFRALYCIFKYNLFG